MMNKEIRVLRVFEEIGRNPCISQRVIADRLEMSLGLVNSMIKQMIRKGYFTAFQMPGKKVRYLLTPEGSSEKFRLTYSYIKHVVDLSIKTNEDLNHILVTLKNEKVTNVVLFGFGSIAEVVIQLMTVIGLKPVAIVDDRKIGHESNGLKVIGIRDLNSISYDKIVITEFVDHRYSIDSILALGISRECLATLDRNISAGFV
jgi:DNA-binding MarR family transcriptional regulator